MRDDAGEERGRLYEDPSDGVCSRLGDSPLPVAGRSRNAAQPLASRQTPYLTSLCGSEDHRIPPGRTRLDGVAAFSPGTRPHAPRRRWAAWLCSSATDALTSPPAGCAASLPARHWSRPRARPAPRRGRGRHPGPRGESALLRGEDGQVQDGAVATTVAVVRIPRQSWPKFARLRPRTR